jgi:hypothetical protein
MQSISTVSAESSKLLHKPLAGRLVCEHCVLSPIRRFTPPPAWIAHGILDSVVNNPASTITPILPANTQALRILPVRESIPPANAWALPVPAGEKLVTTTSVVDEKHAFSKDVASLKKAKTQSSLPRLTCGLMLRRWQRAISRFVNFCHQLSFLQLSSRTSPLVGVVLHLGLRLAKRLPQFLQP